MKALVMGVVSLSGVSKKNGQAYSFANLNLMQPIKERSGDTTTLVGGGYEQMQLQVEPDAVSKFRALRFPCELELLTDMRAYNGKVEVIVCGFAPAPVKAAA